MTGGPPPLVLQSPHLLHTWHSWDWEDELSLGSFLQFGLEGSLAQVPQESWDRRACHQGLQRTQSAPPPQCPLLPPGTVEPTGAQASSSEAASPTPSFHPPPSSTSHPCTTGLWRRPCPAGCIPSAQTAWVVSKAGIRTSQMRKHTSSARTRTLLEARAHGRRGWLEARSGRTGPTSSLLLSLPEELHTGTPGTHSTMITLCPLRG